MTANPVSGSASQSIGQGHHLMLVDGSGFIFRAYHALPPLTRKSDGLPVGAVSGFCNMLLKFVEEIEARDAPTHVAVVFDHKGKTFRSEIYPAYKANRPPAPEDLVPQFPLTRDATRAFNLPCLELAGFEADDIIASLAVQARDRGARVTIISSDKDLMQIVGQGVEMRDPMKNTRIGPEEVEAKFGVPPARVVDVQALAGDSVDNIPGAPGIGIKTAALLITEFGDLDALLAGAETIKQPKRRQTLLEMADQIRISRALATLKTDIAFEFGFDALEFKDPKPEQLLGFLQEMEFRTLTSRIAKRFDVTPPAPVAEEAQQQAAPQSAQFCPALPFAPSAYAQITDMAALEALIAEATHQGYVAFDTETTSLDEMQAALVGVSLSLHPGHGVYIPLAHVSGADDLFGGATRLPEQLPFEAVLAALKPLLEDPAVLKIGQNIKYDLKIMARYGVALAPIEDTMLLSYALHGGLHGHGMDALSALYLNHEPIAIKTLLGSGKSAITFDQVPLAQATPYAAEDADITMRLWKTFRPELHRAKVTRVYEGLERPLVPVLAQMEQSGILVDRDHLSRLSNNFAQSMAGLEAEIHALAGRSFNVGSPKQLGEILFDEMGLQGGKKGKAGAYTTNVDVLEDLASEGHDLPARVLDWRQLSKLKSTYTDALQQHINPETGRVHTSYSIAGANTGRLASTDPNLQNIPIRSEAGRQIREAFIPAPGARLVSLDYSQIELRILAHIARIDTLAQAFHDGVDIHALTASQMFNVPLEGMDPMVRRQAKAINFGVIYGISGFGLARNLRIPRAEAQAFIDTYFTRFPGIRAYMDATVAFAKQHGHVETLFGRRIHTPGIDAKGPQAGFSKRAAINAPIQGTAADIIRRAMIAMPEAIADLPAKMLLQVHDELVFEVAEEAVDPLIARAKKVMERAASPIVALDVPLVVDAGVGLNWAEAH